MASEYIESWIVHNLHTHKRYNHTHTYQKYRGQCAAICYQCGRAVYRHGLWSNPAWPRRQNSMIFWVALDYLLSEYIDQIFGLLNNSINYFLSVIGRARSRTNTPCRDLSWDYFHNRYFHKFNQIIIYNRQCTLSMYIVYCKR